MKSEFAIKWDKWLHSVEGKKCSDRTTLTDTTDQYLINRLNLSFIAGREAIIQIKARSDVEAEVKAVACRDWISVKDKLPDDEQQVIAGFYNKRGEFQQFMDIFNSEIYHRKKTDFERYSHWMPLPSKPSV